MRFTLLFALSIYISSAFAQFPTVQTSANIYHEMLKAQHGTNVLYIAAHPDDENTRLISYFENEKKYRTAYLSLTRGDGGQNLIGTEIGAAIGILRTQELLGARRIDGGEQFFTRAVDFGYSKSSEESFDLWERDSILSDMVWVIRKFRPEVIVTRFPPTNYAGHGHHKASAILAEQAFEMAADPAAYPEQLNEVSVWQTKSMYFNTSSWWNKNLEDEASNSNDYIRTDVGPLNPIIGESYSQIAARSRSQHRSQGFGSDYPNGTQIEYLKYVKGDRLNLDEPQYKSKWDKNNASKALQEMDKVVANYDFKSPEKSADGLIAVAKKLDELESNPFVKYKQAEIHELIVKCLSLSTGLYFKSQYFVPNSNGFGRLEVTNPSGIEVLVKAAKFQNQTWELGEALIDNTSISNEYEFAFPADMATSNPYWLNEPYTTTYSIPNRDDVGKPQNDPSVFVRLEMEVNGYTFTTKVNAFQKNVDPAKAVIYNPVYIVPSLVFNFSEDALVATGNQTKTVSLTVTNFNSSEEGTLSMSVPEGWTISPASYALSFEESGESQMVSFELTSTPNAQAGFAKPNWNSANGMTQTYSLQEIKYDHIPAQIILRPSQMALKPIKLNKGAVNLIGYIEGPGDDVAKYLSVAGYNVEIISPDDLLAGNDLDKYDAIVTGIRAYNTRADLVYANEKLNKYVENGGTWLVQYNTAHRLKTEEIGPLKFSLTRERVTDENAEAKILEPNHPVMLKPNKLDDADWNNWVQERGLYFAADWDKAFQPIISWHDEGEPAREGGLIIANYGKGYFVYSGISFFRELPAGVPGAYRLLANILDLSNTEDGPAND